ncbi:WXG100 family type VII secretion target [Mycobacteriaceae bacterium NPDC060252]
MSALSGKPSASIDVEKAFAAADQVQKNARSFREELEDLRREWEVLAGTWRGSAATAYEAPWQRWVKSASTLVEELGTSAEKIGRTAYQLQAQDGACASGISSVGQ